MLLAAGGFEHNPGMRAAYRVPGRVEDSLGAPDNTGAAHEAAIRVGASTDLMDQAWWSPGLIHPGGGAAFALWFTGGIFVNQFGQRFVNESAPYDRIGREIIAQIEAGRLTLPFWMVYDDRGGEVPPIKATNLSLVDTESYRAAGLWRTADTIADLAADIGVPATALADTVARHNDMVAAGVDSDFGRGDEAYDRSFSRSKPPLTPHRHRSLPCGRVRPLRPRDQGRIAHRYPGQGSRRGRRGDPRPLRGRQHHGRGQLNDLSRRWQPYRCLHAVQPYRGAGHGQPAIINPMYPPVTRSA